MSSNVVSLGLVAGQSADRAALPDERPPLSSDAEALAGQGLPSPAGWQPLNRERSILDFNHRVLAQARRADVPLLERLRYITIVSSNMDEYFEVRVAEYLDALRAGLPGAASGDFQAIAAGARAIIDEQYRLFNDEVMPALAAQGIHILNHADRDAAQRRWVARCFEQQVRPLLMPVALDPSHPFPQVANKSLNFIVRLGPAPGAGGERAVAIVKVPRVLPRVMRLPDALMGRGEQGFVLLTSVIRAHLAELFPDREVEAFSQFRVTRDSDLEVDEDDVTNLRQALRSGLTTRHFGQALRLEVVKTCPPELSDLLLQQFDLPLAALYPVNGPVNLVRMNQLIDLADAPQLRFVPHEPAWTPALPPQGSIFEALQSHDVVLHHPFESFEPVVQFLREAVADPEVLAIKQTIYRTGSQSVLMDLLLEAVRRGKEVMVVLELKARFDEEANINWAERLEAVGAQVVYGIVGLKTHAKLLLVTRREPDGRRGRRGAGDVVLRRYAHLSTGNYNPRTARLYTDVGMLTADPDLTADADAMFFGLAGGTPPRGLRVLLAAPLHLHARFVALLGQVAEAARAGRSARVVVKVNALTDPGLMDALVQAARAGARIDLVVRGACMLPPGLPGVGDRIRVRSVVGRFLEHTRVLYFRWGDGAADEALYLSSADWMARNMARRVELAWPVRDATLRQRVIDECLVPYLHDGRDAWTLGADGGYTAADGSGPSAQQALMRRHAAGRRDGD
ncbi:polyphosphate kinase 1 [Ideonella sp. A 288]|uniref:polyphosphate kinase 1 n=1 Tax=Ideonella sp. A 288 TaxID=1962181 RepID=UPI000B4B7DE0|nr:polyphosphate kinase 1 [Ideonella sp. A 288]